MSNYDRLFDEMKLKEAKKRHEDFARDHFDKKMIANYFKSGMEAKVFTDPNTGKILSDKDIIYSWFADRKYLYTIMRQPLKR